MCVGGGGGGGHLLEAVVQQGELFVSPHHRRRQRVLGEATLRLLVRKQELSGAVGALVPREPALGVKVALVVRVLPLIFVVIVTFIAVTYLKTTKKSISNRRGKDGLLEAPHRDFHELSTRIIFLKLPHTVTSSPCTSAAAVSLHDEVVVQDVVGVVVVKVFVQSSHDVGVHVEPRTWVSTHNKRSRKQA